MSRPIRIATRQSPLALWQAEHVAELLKRHHLGLEVELVKMVTQGDKILDAPLAKLGGKGLFVKELEQGLLEDKADLAVHSMKDVPSELPEGLILDAILEREDPRDALVSNLYDAFESLPSNAVIGTSSLRRQSQLKRLLPDCRTVTLRGNVGTRLDKLDSENMDAIVLAAAGLKRLGLGYRVKQFLSTIQSLPAVGQGAIGIECRSSDSTVRDLIRVLHHEPTAICVTAERAFNHRLNGGCQVPIGGYAELFGDKIKLKGMVASPLGKPVVESEIEGPLIKAEQLGMDLADRLLSLGADRILSELYG